MEHRWFGSNGRSNCSFLGFRESQDPYNIHDTSYDHPTNRPFCQPILEHDCSRKSFYHDIGIPLVLFIYKAKQREIKKLLMKRKCLINKILECVKRQMSHFGFTKPQKYDDE